MRERAHVLNAGEMVAPEPSLTDTGPLYNQLSFPSFPVPALPPVLFQLVLWGKLVRATFVLIYCPFFSSGVFAFGFWMQTNHSFCWKNNHQCAAQLVTLFLWSAGESIIRRFLFSPRGKRQWFVPLFRSQKKVKNIIFWWLLCLSAPTVVEAAVIAQDGGFIDWDHVWGGLSHRHTAAAALLASPAGVHKELSQGVPGSTTGQLAGKSPYSVCIPAALCFCNGSIFFYLVIIFYTGTVRPLYKMIPHGSAHGILPTSWWSKWG